VRGIPALRLAEKVARGQELGEPDDDVQVVHQLALDSGGRSSVGIRFLGTRVDVRDVGSRVGTGHGIFLWGLPRFFSSGESVNNRAVYPGWPPRE